MISRTYCLWWTLKNIFSHCRDIIRFISYFALAFDCSGLANETETTGVRLFPSLKKVLSTAQKQTVHTIYPVYNTCLSS